MSEDEWQTKPSLRQWASYAGELVHPKSARWTYPLLEMWPELQDHARDLLKASQAEASTTAQWAIADRMSAVLYDIKNR